MKRYEMTGVAAAAVAKVAMAAFTVEERAEFYALAAF